MANNLGRRKYFPNGTIVIYKNPCALTTRGLQQGVLDNGEEIAVKKLHQMLWIDNEQFKNELNNLMRVKHKNIVRLFGYCHNIAHKSVEYKELVSARVEQRALCLEYLQGGSLDKHISGMILLYLDLSYIRISYNIVDYKNWGSMVDLPVDGSTQMIHAWACLLLMA